jgi:hypothetical protein
MLGGKASPSAEKKSKGCRFKILKSKKWYDIQFSMKHAAAIFFRQPFWLEAEMYHEHFCERNNK